MDQQSDGEDESNSVGSHSEPHVPLLQLPPPPRETVRPSPSKRKEQGFTIGRGRSPSIEPETTHGGTQLQKKVRSPWLLSLL